MKIITALGASYNIGTSTFIYNMAKWAAKRGHKVLLMDWSFNAPIQHELLGIDNMNNKGIIDYFQAFVHFMKKQINVEEGEVDAIFKPLLQASIIECLDNDIDFIPAFSDAIQDDVFAFNWVKFYEELDGGFFLKLFKGYIESMGYDYVFIDTVNKKHTTSGMSLFNMGDIQFFIASKMKGFDRINKYIHKIKGYEIFNSFGNLCPIPVYAQKKSNTLKDERAYGKFAKTCVDCRTAHIDIEKLNALSGYGSFIWQGKAMAYLSDIEPLFNLVENIELRHPSVVS